MWNRQRLKRNARVLLKANYLKVVVVGLILSFLIGSGYNSARGAAKSNDVDIDVTDLFSGNLAFIVAMLIGIAGVIAIALLFNVVLNIFLWNPLEVGCRKVFVDCRYGNAEWCDILYAFKNGYGHIGAVMFMKDLFTFLWTLLFIIRFFRNYPLLLLYPMYLNFASSNCLPHLPYIVRFIIFNLLLVPSTNPLL